MLTSRDRILTTHVGSLPRNDTLTDLLIAREAGKAIDPALLAAEMDRAVSDTVAAQVKAGIDIGNDGEQQRVGHGRDVLVGRVVEAILHRGADDAG